MSTTDRLKQISELLSMAADGRGHDLVVELTAAAAVIDNMVSIQLADAKKYDALQSIGKDTASVLADMVAALECDYARLEELREMRTDWLPENPAKYLDPRDRRDHTGAHWALACPDEAEELAELAAAAGDCESRDDAEERIQQDPLEITMRSDWEDISVWGSRDSGHGDGTVNPAEFCILLGTGGPAARIIGELDSNGTPVRARLEVQDWGTPWTEYRGDAISSDDLLTYCRCFYFGEG